MLLVVVVGAVLYVMFLGNRPTQVDITGLLGGEKIGLFENQEFKEQLKKEYNLSMDYRKDGSFNMVQGSTEGFDYLFPANQLALELYEKLGREYTQQDIVLNTPIVLYSRKPAVDALMEQNIVTQNNGIYYVDMKLLAELIAEGTAWADIGLPELYGNVLVDTTDPNKSNSGNMFLGLLANSLNDGQVVNKDTVDDVLSQIQKIYQQIGLMQSSSADMFNQFLKQGIGAYPIIAGYENQLLEFSKQDPETYEQVKDEIIILYPSPTVWSSHIYIALNEEAELGLKALTSENIQRIAWQEHGFRTITAGTGGVDSFNVAGVPEDITSVMPMPDIDTMQILMDSITH